MNKFCTILLSVLPLAICGLAQTDSGPKVSAHAQQLHDSAIVIDTHADTPQRFLDTNFDIATTDPSDKGQISLDKARKGNLGAEFFSIWVDPGTTDPSEYSKRAFDLIDSVYDQAQRHPDRMMMAYTAADIERAHQEHKLAAMLGIEGGHAIQDDLHLLRDYYRLGVRYMTLSWSNTNDWADSSGDIDDPKVQHHDGLTDFGKQVVLEMNRLGMMVDISHVADKTFWDAIATTKAPVIASHSSARALTDAPRNMTDDMLKAVGKNNGVVMVNFFAGFDDQNFWNASKAQSKDRDAAVAAYVAQQKAAGKKPQWIDTETIDEQFMAKIPRPAFKVLIDNIDHIAKVAGVDHVGLGSDFDGVSGALPEGMNSAADLPKVTQALLDRGYSEQDVRKILGGNLLRVLRDVERVSHETQGGPSASRK